MASGDVGGEAGKGMAPEEARALYDDWGDGYTTSVESWGYTMPHEIAAALASLADDAPSFCGKILDAGAGDGLSGRELRAAGFIVPVDERMQVVALSCEIGERRLKQGAGAGACDLPGCPFRLVLRPGIPQPTQRDTQLGRERRGAALRCHSNAASDTCGTGDPCGRFLRCRRVARALFPMRELGAKRRAGG